MRLGRYIKAAFVQHWNLLAFASGTALAFVSGAPDVVLPLVVAAELAYLGLLGTHPRFQKAVDASEAKRARAGSEVTAEQAFVRISSALPQSSLRRYEALRARCAELRDIAGDLRRVAPPEGPLPFEKLQVAGLDRLLWIFLRLLYTQHALGRFLDQTSEQAIRQDIERLREQLASYEDGEANPRREKARQTLRDTLATSEDRLANLEKARENHELVQLEIDRLESKIRSLSELAVNRQEPDFISDQIDAVATSMLETERTMNDLEFATGFGPLDEATPELLGRRVLETG